MKNKLIRIDAKSKLFSIDEVVEEKKSYKRLETIRKNFERYSYKTHDDKLTVVTSIYNPTLF